MLTLLSTLLRGTCGFSGHLAFKTALPKKPEQSFFNIFAKLEIPLIFFLLNFMVLQVSTEQNTLSCFSFIIFDPKIDNHNSPELTTHWPFFNHFPKLIHSR